MCSENKKGVIWTKHACVSLLLADQVRKTTGLKNVVVAPPIGGIETEPTKAMMLQAPADICFPGEELCKSVVLNGTSSATQSHQENLCHCS